MNTQIALALIPYVVPSVIGLLVYTYHQVWQRIPEKQRNALEQLATPAVQMVEQQYKNASPEQKKEAALHQISLAFTAFNLPEPDSSVINAFIESAVFEMNRLKSNTTQPLPTLQGGNSIDPHMATDLLQHKRTGL